MPDEIDERTELEFVCPHCEGGIAHLLDRDEVWIACPYCEESISLAAQQAISRAYDNYTYARELTTRELLGGRKSMRRLNQLSPDAKDALRIYQKAYTGVQRALQAPIPEALRALGIEMMAEIVRILRIYHMVTGLEAEYWTELMIWQTAREEYEALDERLNGGSASLLVRLFRHPHWRVRRFQLSRALDDRRERLGALKQELNLVNTFYV